MNPTNESIGRASEILRMVVDGRISGRISEWPQLKWACEEAARELDRQAKGEDGDWYTSGHGSRVIDLDQDPANQLSILLKDDGTVSAVVTRNGSATCGGYGLGEVADVIRSWAAPQPPAQEQGEWGGYEAFEQFLAAEIDSAPEALRRLGKWLGNVLDEDHFATANRLVLGAMLETSDAIRKVAASKAAPQPPAQEQGDFPVAWAYRSEDPYDAGQWMLQGPAWEGEGRPDRREVIPLYTRAAGAEDARGVTGPATIKEQGSYREVIQETLKWNGVPCFVTGRVWTHNNNWPLIDAAIASQAKEGEK